MKKVARLAVKVQREVVLVGGAVITVGEILAASLPKGTVQTGLRVAIPILVAVVQRTRTVPVGTLTQIVQAVENRKGSR